MEFVISDIVTYNKYYAKDAHRFIQMHSIEDLEGFPKITVRVHEFDALSEEQESLQKQVEALATFGIIRLVYLDEESNENKFCNVLKPITESNNQKELRYTEDTREYTEEQVQAFMDSEEGGCASGACSI
jgi:hypothetical protein